MVPVSVNFLITRDLFPRLMNGGQRRFQFDRMFVQIELQSQGDLNKLFSTPSDHLLGS